MKFYIAVELFYRHLAAFSFVSCTEGNIVKQFKSDTDRKFCSLIFAFFNIYECSLAGTSTDFCDRS